MPRRLDSQPVQERLTIQRGTELCANSVSYFWNLNSNAIPANTYGRSAGMVDEILVCNQLRGRVQLNPFSSSMWSRAPSSASGRRAVLIRGDPVTCHTFRDGFIPVLE